MKRVTEQLTEYYQAQGLTGEDLSAAVAADVERVRDNVRAEDEDPDTEIDDSDSIATLFDWSATGQGLDYWSERNV